MNLHGIVRGQIAAVNPDETVALTVSTGYTTAADGTQIPTYVTNSALAQFQAMAGRDLRQVERLNLQGTLRKVYFFGDVEGIVRVTEQGGDLITRSDQTIWLVNQVLETWPDWCAVAATLQNETA